MKERDRQAFRDMVNVALANGATLTEAIARAYAWLLKPSREVWPR